MNMKNMKTIKSVVAMLVMVLALGCVSITAEAATKKDSLTLYVGESVAYSYYGMGTIKSVKSNKSKIVKASKYKGGSKMVAKKKGTAKVTVKGTKGTWITTVKVKAKPKFKVTLTPRADGYLTVQFKNTSSVYVDSATVDITYKDAAGNVLGTDTEYFSCIGAKKTATGETYVYVYPYDEESIDWSKTTYEVTYDRSINYKYSDYTKKVKFSTSVGTNASGSKILNVKTKISYKGDNGIYAGYSVYFYDAAGNVCGIRDYYHYMSGSKKKYRTNTTAISFPSDAVSYKLVNKRAFMKKYSK